MVRSLDWEVSKGPLWKDEEQREAEADPYFEDEEAIDQMTYQERMSSLRVSHAKNRRMMKDQKIQDGDYVYGPEMQGVYYVRQC